MNNFRLIKDGLDVSAALEEIRKSNLWNWMNIRRVFPMSCHTKIQDVVFRGPRIDVPQTYETLMSGLDMVSYFPWFSHREVRGLVSKAFAGVVSEDSTVGRIVASKIPPGGSVDPHPDEGIYAQNHDRYHIVLCSDEKGCEFHCGDEVVFMQSGQLWIFNHEEMHEVFNRSDSDRINLIVDIKR